MSGFMRGLVLSFLGLLIMAGAGGYFLANRQSETMKQLEKTLANLKVQRNSIGGAQQDALEQIMASDSTQMPIAPQPPAPTAGQLQAQLQGQAQAPAAPGPGLAPGSPSAPTAAEAVGAEPKPALAAAAPKGFVDPRVIEMVNRMNIPDSLKRELIRSYQLTGTLPGLNLPTATADGRGPASEDEDILIELDGTKPAPRSMTK